MNDDKPTETKSGLNVFLNDELIGRITTDDGVDIQFSYAASWLESRTAFPISISLPLSSAAIPDEIANNFFTNLLPEENIRKRTCEKLGISEGNNFELLRRIGGDCAGALAILDENEPAPRLQNSYEPISEKQLEKWSKGDQYAFAQVAGEKDVRLSLAGAQDKLPVKMIGNEFFLPKGNSPSTHILKFASRFSHLPENETLTTMLARAVGVPTVNISLHQTTKSRIAVVERYDRFKTKDNYDRIHQEDFCQALGIHPARKYQQEGGPNLKRCSDLIKSSCSIPAVELDKFLRWIIFNWLAHNADAHVKNISFLFADGVTALAPFYDLVCTRNYPNLSKTLAMSIGGEFHPGAVTIKNLELMSEDLDVKSSYVREVAMETATDLIDRVKTTVDEFKDLFGDSPILQRIPGIVQKRCRRVLALQKKVSGTVFRE